MEKKSPSLHARLLGIFGLSITTTNFPPKIVNK